MIKLRFAKQDIVGPNANPKILMSCYDGWITAERFEFDWIFVEWMANNNIDWDYQQEPNHVVLIFKKEEDAVLFKMGYC
jgi:hypothetical protein